MYQYEKTLNFVSNFCGRRLSLFLFIRPNFVEHFHETIVNHEGNCNIKDNSGHSRHGTLIKAFWTFVNHNCFRAVECRFVFASFKTLHPCFDHIYRSVAKNRTGSGKTTKKANEQFWYFLVRVSTFVPVFQRFH